LGGELKGRLRQIREARSRSGINNRLSVAFVNAGARKMSHGPDRVGVQAGLRMNYAFDFFDAAGKIDHVDLGFYEGDEAALADARRALTVTVVAVAVDIWRNERFVATLERTRGHANG
jgi:hypothetical protein